MFYVANGKIYLDEFDGKIYPEMKLRVDTEGNYFFERLKTGISKKPINRRLLNKTELIAKFGNLALETETKE